MKIQSLLDYLKENDIPLTTPIIVNGREVTSYGLCVGGGMQQKIGDYLSIDSGRSEGEVLQIKEQELWIMERMNKDNISREVAKQLFLKEKIEPFIPVNSPFFKGINFFTYENQIIYHQPEFLWIDSINYKGIRYNTVLNDNTVKDYITQCLLHRQMFFCCFSSKKRLIKKDRYGEYYEFRFIVQSIYSKSPIQHNCYVVMCENKKEEYIEYVSGGSYIFNTDKQLNHTHLNTIEYHNNIKSIVGDLINTK